MEISEFTLKILFIFIPGLVAFYIIDNLTVHKETKYIHIVLKSFLYGVFSYFLYFLYTNVSGSEFYFIKYVSELKVGSKSNIQFKEIIYTTGISVIFAFILTATKNRKLIFRFAHKFGLSNKFGDLDVWSYIFNSELQQWVVLRDFEKKLMYFGWVEAFSDSVDKDELLLSQVTVHDLESGIQVISETIELLYLPIERDNIIIELKS